MRSTLIGVAVLMLAAACHAPSARPYRAYSSEEIGMKERVDPDVYPEMVLAAPEKYGQTIVAWAGIVRDRHLQQTAGGVLATFVIEHRYFDWLEGVGLGRRFLLSRQGEGMFYTQWEFPPGTEFDVDLRGDAPGDMLIVYGRPGIQEGIGVSVEALLLRGVDDSNFSQSGMDYGRGEQAPEHEFSHP